MSAGTPAVTPKVTSGTPPSASARERIAQGLGATVSSISSAVYNASEWTPVKTVRNSTVWSLMTWPFRTLGSFLSGIWARIAKAIWGSPTLVTKEVKFEIKGFFYNTTKKMSIESAINEGHLTVEKGIADNLLTLEEAQIKGWVPVTIKGKWRNSTMMLKTAVEGAHMTVEQAIEAGVITKEQAAKADWIKKKQ